MNQGIETDNDNAQNIKTYIDPYEKQSFFYRSPHCTYSQFPPSSVRGTPPQQDGNVFYFSQRKNNTGNYFLYTQAYPSSPYVPCMFPTM